MKNSKDCLTDDQLREFLANLLSKNEKDEIERHLKSCQDCRMKLLEMRWLESSISKKNIETKFENHLDETTLACYAENQLPAAEKLEVERHLLNCADCWEKFLSLETMLDGFDTSALTEPSLQMTHAAEKIVPETGQSRFEKYFEKEVAFARNLLSQRYFVRLVGAVIAAVVCVGIFLSLFQSGAEKGILLRNGKTEYAVKIFLITPKTGAKIVKENMTFSWQLIPNIKQYHFILFNDIGEKIFDEYTDKNHIQLTAKVFPQGQKSYFWQVEGLRKDGSTIKSNLSYFILMMKIQ